MQTVPDRLELAKTDHKVAHALRAIPNRVVGGQLCPITYVPSLQDSVNCVYKACLGRARHNDRSGVHGLGPLDGIPRGNCWEAQHDRLFANRPTIRYHAPSALLQSNVVEIAKRGKKLDNPLLRRICLLYTSPSPRDRTRSRM